MCVCRNKWQITIILTLMNGEIDRFKLSTERAPAPTTKGHKMEQCLYQFISCVLLACSFHFSKKSETFDGLHVNLISAGGIGAKANCCQACEHFRFRLSSFASSKKLSTIMKLLYLCMPLRRAIFWQKSGCHRGKRKLMRAPSSSIMLQFPGFNFQHRHRSFYGRYCTRKIIASCADWPDCNEAKGRYYRQIMWSKKANGKNA